MLHVFSINLVKLMTRKQKNDNYLGTGRILLTDLTNKKPLLLVHFLFPIKKFIFIRARVTCEKKMETRLPNFFLL